VALLATIAALATACVEPPPPTGAVTVTAPSPTVAYGDEISELQPTYTPAISPTTPATCSTTATSASPVGAYPVVCSGAVHSGRTFQYVAGELTIAPAEVTVTASTGTTTYGQDAPAIEATYEGLVGITEPDVLATCSTDATSTSPAGTYASSCGGSSAANHSFTYVDGTITVGAAPVSVTAASASMTYGGDAPVIAPIYSGLVGGDAGPATPPECSTDATSASPVGEYTSTCAEAADPNYTFSYVDGVVTVIAAPAVVLASSASIGQGVAIPAVTASYSGFVNGDTAPATAPLCSTTADGSSPAGSYPTTCAGAADPNYTFSYVDGVLTIVPGATPVTVTASSATITYGETAPTITASYDGLPGGQTVPETEAVCASGAVDGSPVGTYPTFCADAADPGSTFVYVAGTITILPAPATVTASSSSSAYGDDPGTVSPSYSGLVNGDAAPATVPTCSTGATATSPVGSYGTTCVGAADPNYTFDTVDGTHEVTPAAAVVTASSATMTEGEDVPTVTPSYAGLVNGDTAPATAPVCTTVATPASPAGTYATSCAGTDDPNYTFSHVDGVLTVEEGVDPEPTPIGTVLTYAPNVITTTTTGTGTLPTGTIPVASGTGAGFAAWANLTVETTTGFHEVFCNGVTATSFTTCTLGSGQLFPGGLVSNVPVNTFDVYDLVGGPSAVEPSSLTIVEDVPASARARNSFVAANATHGLVNYVQSPTAAGDFSLTFGICDTGTPVFDAEDPACTVGELEYRSPLTARIGARITVSIATQTIYNEFPLAASAPAAVDQGETFSLKWATAPGAMPQRQSAPIVGQVTVNFGSTFASYIPVPAGATYVPGSARLVGGDARMSDHAGVTYCAAAGGACDASLTGNFDLMTQPYLKVSVPNDANGRVPGGRTFSMPTLEADFVASGSSGSQLKFALLQYRNITNTSLATADFRGYATESTTTSAAPTKAAGRAIHTLTIN
jgi:hypothetical protein